MLGVTVPLIRDPKEISRREKAIWTVALFSLLMLEVKSVYQDRNEHDRAERESRERSEQNFREIAGGIQGTLNGLDTTIKEGREHFEAELKGLDINVKTITGGNSYCYFVVDINEVSTVTRVRFMAQQVVTSLSEVFLRMYGTETRYASALRPTSMCQFPIWVKASRGLSSTTIWLDLAKWDLTLCLMA